MQHKPEWKEIEQEQMLDEEGCPIGVEDTDCDFCKRLVGWTMEGYSNFFRNEEDVLCLDCYEQIGESVEYGKETNQ